MGRTPLFSLLQRAARIARASLHMCATPGRILRTWPRASRRCRAASPAAGRRCGPVAGRLRTGAAAADAARAATKSSSSAPASPDSPRRGGCARPACGCACSRRRTASADACSACAITFADGQVIELGGELIDTGHARIRALAAELGLVLDDLLDGETASTTPGSSTAARSREREIVAAFVPVAAAIERDLGAARRRRTRPTATPILHSSAGAGRDVDRAMARPQRRQRLAAQADRRRLHHRDGAGDRPAVGAEPAHLHRHRRSRTRSRSSARATSASMCAAATI